MRIAIDMRSVAETGGQISGVENYFVNVFNRLQGQKSADVHLLSIINRYKNVILPDSLSDPTSIHQTHLPNKIFNSMEFLLHRPYFENLYGDFDVLWMPDIRPFSVQTKTKMALTVHDISPITNPEYYSVRRRLWHHVADYRRAINRADLIFAVSEYTKQDIIKKLNISPEKIEVVYPGVDLDCYKPLSELEPGFVADVRQRYSLPENYILALSTIEPRKNISNLITAFENSSVAGLKNTHLVIAGKLGWLYQPILKRIYRSPLRDKIHMLGYVKETDKPVILAAANLLCYPSFHEGFGFQPLEAMACGVPVVAGSRTSVPEVCGNGALLVEPNHPEDIASGINSLLDDSELRAQFIAAGFQRVKRFNWQDTAKGVYDGCMKLAQISRSSR